LFYLNVSVNIQFLPFMLCHRIWLSKFWILLATILSMLEGVFRT
jgi:hypothetical protein